MAAALHICEGLGDQAPIPNILNYLLLALCLLSSSPEDISLKMICNHVQLFSSIDGCPFALMLLYQSCFKILLGIARNVLRQHFLFEPRATVLLSLAQRRWVCSCKWLTRLR